MSKNMIHHTEYVTPKIIPWVEVFKDLDEVGKGHSQMCQLMGIPHATLFRWKTGECEPKHSIGVTILLLHSRYCGEELTIERELQAKNLTQLRPKDTTS